MRERQTEELGVTPPVIVLSKFSSNYEELAADVDSVTRRTRTLQKGLSEKGDVKLLKRGRWTLQRQRCVEHGQGGTKDMVACVR